MKKLKRFQQECFDLAIEMNLHYLKKNFVESYNKSRDKEFTLKYEIEKIDIFINENKNVYSKVIKGIKGWYLIDGQTYKKFKSQYDRHLQGKSKISVNNLNVNKSLIAHINLIIGFFFRSLFRIKKI